MNITANGEYYFILGSLRLIDIHWPDAFFVRK
jgi:hypothetical protein